MNKEEILAKSRSENREHDERDMRIFDKSFYFSFLGMGIMAAVLSISHLFNGDSPPYDILIMLMSAAAGAYIYRFVKSRRLRELFVALICLLNVVIWTVRFFMEL